MSLTDPHDPRRFRQYVKLTDAGTVAGTVLYAEGWTGPVDDATGVYVDVTAHYPIALHDLTVDPALVAAVRGVDVTGPSGPTGPATPTPIDGGGPTVTPEDPRDQLAAAIAAAVRAKGGR